MTHQCPGFGWDRVNFLPSSCFFFVFCMWRMVITLLFIVVAMKSRTFSSFSYSANEWVCSRWEAAQPGSWPIKMFHAIDVMLSLWTGVGPGGRNLLFSLPWVQILSCPGVRTSLGVLWNLQNPGVQDSAIDAQGLTANQSLGGEKIALYVVCFTSSLSSLLLVVLIFTLLPY